VKAVAKPNGLARDLAEWAVGLRPTQEDLDLAQRCLLDTVAVALAAHTDEVRGLAELLPNAGRWATIAHVLDFDDLHMESTTHISAVCVPVVLACHGPPRAFLAAAGVMSRLGTALGWRHYTSGWHATCTTGAPAAAVAAAVSADLSAEQVTNAIGLALPAAGGVQRAFGTQGKSLQVGFAADAGVRAATLAAAGATTDPSVLEQWLGLLGGDADALDLTGNAVPGGLAIKLAPCCYALQRPIHVARLLVHDGLPVDQVTSLIVRTPAAAIQPLIHHRPDTGLQAKFSLEYAVAATLLDPYPGFDAFTDEAVRQPAVRRLVDLVNIQTAGDGEGLLSGDVQITAIMADGSSRSACAALPPGAPAQPPTEDEFRAKLTACRPDLLDEMGRLTWDSAADLMAAELPAGEPGRHRHGRNLRPADRLSNTVSG
jgi:2-methylcitrate dehydratase PrpD